MRPSSLLHIGIRALGGALLAAALFLPAAAGRSAAAPLAQSTGGYWQYVETINNSQEQAVDPIYTAEKWSPQFFDSSVSATRTQGTVTTSGSCDWGFETDGGIDRLDPGDIVIVHLSASYSGVSPDTLLNQLYAYACFNQAGVMGGGVSQFGNCSEQLVIPGPGGSDTLALEVYIPEGPNFPDGRGALEVKCCPDCYATMSVQRVYQWVAGPTPVEAPPATGPAIDCGSVLLSYSPDPPQAGDDVYLNAGVSSTIGNAPGFYSRWELDGTVLPGAVIEEWGGCSQAVRYVYFCNGSEQAETMILPGADCVAGINWRAAAGVAGLAAAVAAAAAILRRARKGGSKGPEQYILHLSVEEVKIAAGQSAPVTATVYKVTPQGAPVPVPDAQLRLSVSREPAGLKAQPLSGSGALTFRVSADAGCTGGVGSVKVQGRAAGTAYSSTVRVEVRARYWVEMTCQDARRVVPAAPGEVWAYARVASADPVPQTDLDELTRKIRFSLADPNAGAVERRGEQFAHGWQAVRLFQVPAKVSGPGSPTLVASVSVDGKPLKPGELGLALKTAVVLSAWVRGGKEADLVYDARSRSWDIPEVSIYFHEPGDDGRAVKPPFAYAFASPAATVAPALLAVQEIAGREQPDQFVLRLVPAPGADLAKAAAGPAPVVIRVTVTAVDTETMTRYPAEVTLRLKRQAELHFSPKELKLKPGQPAELEITLYEAGEGGKPLPDAHIWLSPKETVPGLAVRPADGKSPLRVSLSLEKGRELYPKAIELEVHGQAGTSDPVEAAYRAGVLAYAVEFREQPRQTIQPGLGTVGRAAARYRLLYDREMTAYAVVLDLTEDPAETDGALSEQIQIGLSGPNQQAIKTGVEAYDGLAKTLSLRFVAPPEGQEMEDSDPSLTAQLGIDGWPVQGHAELNLDLCRLEMLRAELERYSSDLQSQGYYARNPWLGRPSGLVGDAAYQLYSVGWDWSAGWLASKSRSRKCEAYIHLTEAEVVRLVRRAYGGRAKLEQWDVREYSSTDNATGIINTIDAIYAANHTLFKLITPDGQEYGIDFWERHRGWEPTMRVLEPWPVFWRLWRGRLFADWSEQDSFGRVRVILA